MRRRFATLDVFTDRRFAGNPLAVVLDAEALDAAAMQAIAREFNHPETVFVLRAGRPRAPRARSHFHPGAGAAVRRPPDRRDRGAARRARRRRPRPRAGGRDRRGALHARIDERRRRQRPLRDPAIADRGRARRRTIAAIAAALSLAPSDIGRAARRDGRPAFPSPSCRSQASPRWRVAVPISPSSTPPSAPVGRPTCSATRPPSPVTIFMPACSRPAMGIPEDPATGSAAAAFAGVLASPPARRHPHDRDRAGLRDGPAEPDPPHGRGRRRTARFRVHRRRRRRRDRGHDRGVRAPSGAVVRVVIKGQRRCLNNPRARCAPLPTEPGPARVRRFRTGRNRVNPTSAGEGLGVGVHQRTTARPPPRRHSASKTRVSALKAPTLPTRGGG